MFSGCETSGDVCLSRPEWNEDHEVRRNPCIIGGKIPFDPCNKNMGTVQDLGLQRYNMHDAFVDKGHFLELFGGKRCQNK